MRALLLIVLFVGPAWANPYDLFGAGARAQGMAGAATALSGDYLSTFHNPAGLAGAGNSLGFGIMGSFNRASIRLAPRPAGYDPPAYDLRLNPREETENPDGVVGVAVGVSLELFSEDLVIGALIFAPLDGFANAQTAFSDEREQYFSNQLRFELIGDRADTEVFNVGLAYRLRPWISMGIGMLLLPQANVVNDVYTPNAARPDEVDLNVQLEQGTKRAITAGLMLQPWDWLRFGAAFQDEVFFAITGHNDVQLNGEEEEDPTRQEIDLVQHYSPPRFTVSLAYLDDDLNATVEATWRGWSRYLDDHGKLADFEDRIEWKAALEYPVGDKTFVRTGLTWSPSPVPDQDGRTNFVDNDRVVFALGAGRDFELWRQDLTIDFGVQLHGLLTRSVDKSTSTAPRCTEDETRLCDEVEDRDEDSALVRAADTKGLQTGNPGFPGFAHGGYVISAGVDFKWRF